MGRRNASTTAGAGRTGNRVKGRKKTNQRGPEWATGLKQLYDSVIEELATRGHDVAIAVINTNAKKPVGIEGLQAYADRVRSVGITRPR